MSVMDTVSEPAERNRKREREKHFMSANMRDGECTQCRENRVVSRSKAEQRTAFLEQGEKQRESDYSSHNTSHLPLGIFLKIF